MMRTNFMRSKYTGDENQMANKLPGTISEFSPQSHRGHRERRGTSARQETIKGQNQDYQDYRITGIIVVYLDEWYWQRLK
jgi:hypothetical protein